MKRLIWQLPEPVHTWIWIVTGRVLMAWLTGGKVVRLEWRRLMKDGKYL